VPATPEPFSPFRSEIGRRSIIEQTGGDAMDACQRGSAGFAARPETTGNTGATPMNGTEFIEQ
jgi:hypothetical protein